VFPALGLAFAVIGMLALFPALSRSFGYQVVLGWTSWVIPMSYLITPLGILLFTANLIVMLITTGALPRLRFDFSTATVESTAGTIAVFLFGSLRSLASRHLSSVISRLSGHWQRDHL
jgi:hypothetical protein